MTDGRQAIIELCKWAMRSTPASGILDVRSSIDDGIANQLYEGIGA